MLTPVSWLAEKLSHIHVGGRKLGSRLPTEHVPNPVLKAGFWLIVVVLFLDEFLILAAMFGGPVALALLGGFAVSVLVVRRTEHGQRAKRRVSSRIQESVASGRKAGYRTRRRTKQRKRK